MATTGEQKANLQTSRLAQARARVRSQGLSPTRFEMGRKHVGVPDPARPSELRQTPQSRSAGAGNLFDVAELEAKRRAALFSSRLQGAVGRNWQAKATQQAVNEDQPQFNRTPEGQDPNQTLKQSRRLALVEQAMQRRSQAQQQENAKDQATQEQTNKQRAEVKKKAEAAMRRGAIAVVDSLAGALDVSSGGISFIIDIFFYGFTLGWLNLEMIYGKYFAKGKSRYISPISWEPIPMPVDKDALFLQGFVVTADIALGLSTLMLLGLGACFMHDFVKVNSGITAALTIGANLAAGGDGGLCFGSMIASLIGQGL